MVSLVESLCVMFRGVMTVSVICRMFISGFFFCSTWLLTFVVLFQTLVEDNYS